RWGLLAMSSGQDVRFSEDKVAQGQQLTNKLWNAARLIQLNVGDAADGGDGPAVTAAAMPTAVEDHWILSRLERARADVAADIEGFDFSHAALGLYDFVYGELCDWYLELVKHRLPDLEEGDEQDEDSREALAATLLYVLRQTVALAHPLIPFVTEELWSYLDGAGDLLAGCEYPCADASLVDLDAEVQIERTIEAIVAVRGWRDSVGARAGTSIPARLRASCYESTAPLLARMARLELIDDGESQRARGPALASVAIPGGAIEILSAEGLDLHVAERRRAAAAEKLTVEIERIRSKLENPGFVAKAPAAVVEGERDRLQRLSTELAAL
ncbi:MAG: class I tRNA ligase family protein, partial [Solirubrobacteraceae bacterium]